MISFRIPKTLVIALIAAPPLCAESPQRNPAPSSKSKIRVRLESALSQKMEVAEARRLILDLGSTDFETRTRATQQLLDAAIPAGLLEAAAEGGNAELSVRARRILTLRPKVAVAELAACLRDAAVERAPDIAHLLLDITSTSLSPLIRDLALAATECCPCDEVGVKAAKRLIGSKDAMSQNGAILALAMAGRRELVRKHLADLPPPVAAEAARSLWNLRDRDALAIWVGLLESDNAEARSASSQYLREATLQRFGYSAAAQRERRETSLKRWQEWIAHQKTNGTTLEYRRIASLTDPYFTGNYRLAAMGNSVYFLGSGGSFLAAIPTPKKVNAVQRTPAGTLLLFRRIESSSVMETTMSGQLLRKFKGQCIIDAKPGDSGEVLTFSEDGDTVSNVKIFRSDGSIRTLPNEKKWIISGVKLPGGDLVVITEGLPLRRITGKKKGTVWKLEELNDVGLACPLPSGNILVSSIGSGQLAEVSADGEILWMRKCRGEAIPRPLRSGNILLERGKTLSEETPDGTVLWKRKMRELKVKQPKTTKAKKPPDREP